MTLQQFIKQWDGGAPDFDGSFGAQCVDLARFYFRDVLAIVNPGPVVGAQDFFFNYDRDYSLFSQFQKVINSPGALPERGDVVLLKATPKNQYGHVCVFVDGNRQAFRSFDCNWSVPHVVQMEPHNYDLVLGWLHPRGRSILECII
jgi:hypothetical protein